ncbi:MAG: CBS domain-containing protein [Actinomycetota bacterium]|nr:CBS domain-containing protein [Actinomycetota bacterium]MDH5223906.1 CBS domain-containing protein [Actinomycetota bacterium]
MMLEVETFMQPGPATVRPVEELRPLVERMKKAGVKSIFVTTAEGRLIGMVRRDHAEHTLGEQPP